MTLHIQNINPYLNMSDILQQKIIKGLRLKNLDLKEENDRLRNLCQQLFIERKNPQVRILNLKDVKNFIFKKDNGEKEDF